MGNIFLALLVGVLSFQTFTLTYQVSTFKKSVVNIPMAIFESCISFFDIANGESKAYFNKTMLNDKIDSYFKKTLTPATNSYSFELSYYDASDKKFCKNDFCDGVKVMAIGTIIYTYKIQETMTYEIKDNRF